MFHADLDLLDGGEDELPELGEDDPGQLAHGDGPGADHVPDVGGLGPGGGHLVPSLVTQTRAQEAAEQDTQGGPHL